MITKVKRNDDSDLVNLVLTDKFGNSFIMMIGGNFDLYWVPENYNQIKSFYFDKDDEFVYKIFTKLFKKIKEEDGNGLNYPKTLNENTFTFISEDFPEDKANRLEIIKEKDQFKINFIKNENLDIYGIFRRGCNICFCNSGSRVPKVEQLFMLMFNELAYYNNEIAFTKWKFKNKKNSFYL